MWKSERIRAGLLGPSSRFRRYLERNGGGFRKGTRIKPGRKKGDQGEQENKSSWAGKRGKV